MAHPYNEIRLAAENVVVNILTRNTIWYIKEKQFFKKYVSSHLSQNKIING